MLLLSFASQTSHFWQLGGVMQAKIRSLLRLLVKSIIWHRDRQADASAAWEAHHSAYSTADPSVRKHTGYWDFERRDRYTCSLTYEHRGTRNGKLISIKRIQRFHFHYGTHLHFFLFSPQKRKSVVENLECHDSHTQILFELSKIFFFFF